MLGCYLVHHFAFVHGRRNSCWHCRVPPELEHSGERLEELHPNALSCGWREAGLASWPPKGLSRTDEQARLMIVMAFKEYCVRWIMLYPLQFGGVMVWYVVKTAYSL